MTHPTDTDVLGEFLISARSSAEYRAIFALTDTDLRDRSILDCPGGAASFTAEASELGAHVTAVDPIYHRTPAELRTLARVESDRANTWARTHSDRYRWDWYGSPDEHHRLRRIAATRFGEDVTANPHRYIPAALPSLPFPDNTFDLVLSSHLLFSYADRLDAEFHLMALVELSRVSRAQTRLYPLLDHIGRPRHELIAGLRTELHDKGIRTEIREVDYEFHHGANTMLVLHAPGTD
ncbi:methyltransferase domain-containing protein [Nocardia bovistercoris]|uniref:Methyltransferase domain-containing protein n=1 Tax=Nocardia bovistercoris TaxID=2785916 RepID=A0A931IBK2_9NOCA|nr:methyltransferase domain-containing protein [Nocardia bovistercoris]MBH0776845.1 methyltransferase domain-containing protein [Nocardia bovistercoris]